MARVKGNKIVVESKVARLLTQWINSESILQSDIAKALGLGRPNIITMFKSGRTALPLKYIVPLAQCLGRDPEVLLDACMEEYHPELAAALSRYKGVTFNVPREA